MWAVKGGCRGNLRVVEKNQLMPQLCCVIVGNLPTSLGPLYHVRSVSPVTRLQTVGSPCVAASLFLLSAWPDSFPLVFLWNNLTFLILLIAPGHEISCHPPDAFPQTALSLNHLTVRKPLIAPCFLPYHGHTPWPGFSGPT